MAHPSRRRRSRQREHEDAAHRRLRLLTDQLTAQAADLGAEPALGPMPGARHAQEGPSPEGAAQLDTGDVLTRQRPKRNAPTTSRAGEGRHAARPMPWHRRLLAALIDRAPAGAHGLTSTHVMVLALVALAAVAMAAWWVTGARPQAAPVANAASIEEPVTPGQPGVEAPPAPSDEPLPPGPSEEPTPTPSPSTTPVTGVPDGAATQASQPSEVVVDVAGKVRRPGIVVLPSGSRVADALEAAGGVRPGVDRHHSTWRVRCSTVNRCSLG